MKELDIGPIPLKSLGTDNTQTDRFMYSLNIILGYNDGNGVCSRFGEKQYFSEISSPRRFETRETGKEYIIIF